MTLNSAEIRQEIERDVKAWQDAFNRKDAQAITVLYTEDGWLSNLRWTATGREALKQNWEEVFRRGIFSNGQIKTEQVQSVGDSAVWVSGAWSADMTQPMVQSQGTSSQKVEGHWLLVTERRGGEWKIRAHVINMKMPR